MPQTSTNTTFKTQALPNTGGVKTPNGETLAVEFLTADPTDLTTNFPRVWVNITSGTMKFTVNGTVTKTVTAT